MNPSDRTVWFTQARFGMFIHWELYSVLGHGEWAFNRERWNMKDLLPQNPVGFEIMRQPFWQTTTRPGRPSRRSSHAGPQDRPLHPGVLAEQWSAFRAMKCWRNNRRQAFHRLPSSSPWSSSDTPLLHDPVNDYGDDYGERG
jgi:hypothetical protein